MKDLTRRALLRSTPTLALPLGVGAATIRSTDCGTTTGIVPTIDPLCPIGRLAVEYGRLIGLCSTLYEAPVDDGWDEDAYEDAEGDLRRAEEALHEAMRESKLRIIVVQGRAYIDFQDTDYGDPYLPDCPELVMAYGLPYWEPNDVPLPKPRPKALRGRRLVRAFFSATREWDRVQKVLDQQAEAGVDVETLQATQDRANEAAAAVFDARKALTEFVSQVGSLPPIPSREAPPSAVECLHCAAVVIDKELWTVCHDPAYDDNLVLTHTTLWSVQYL